MGENDVEEREGDEDDDEELNLNWFTIWWLFDLNGILFMHKVVQDSFGISVGTGDVEVNSRSEDTDDIANEILAAGAEDELEKLDKVVDPELFGLRTTNLCAAVICLRLLSGFPPSLEIEEDIISNDLLGWNLLVKLLVKGFDWLEIFLLLKLRPNIFEWIGLVREAAEDVVFVLFEIKLGGLKER